VIVFLTGLFVHYQAYRGKAHEGEGVGLANRHILRTPENVAFVNSWLHRRATWTLSLSLPGILLISYFVAGGVRIYWWAALGSLVLLFASMIPLVRIRSVLDDSGQGGAG
ncbi:MAG: hypothetical protein Q4F67_11870, partial [Propionibacteriaceae bacterium]|nr:hypothetical protein [Propionibacteriaceae bacterium]